MNSVDNLRQLKEFLWCDHVGLSIQSYGPVTMHAALVSKAAVHIVLEDGKIKVICHGCWVANQQLTIGACYK